jgi:hypothetical protein
MTFIFISIFLACAVISTVWWIVSDFWDKRQAYWYEAWRKCDGERGFLKLRVRNLENTYWKEEYDKLELEKRKLENEYNSVIIELEKLKES